MLWRSDATRGMNADTMFIAMHSSNVAMNRGTLNSDAVGSCGVPIFCVLYMLSEICSSVS